MSDTSQSSPTKSLKEVARLLDLQQEADKPYDMPEDPEDESRFENYSDDTSRPPSQQRSSNDEEDDLEGSQGDPICMCTPSQADPPPATQNTPPASPNPRVKKRPRLETATDTCLSDPESTDDSVVARPIQNMDRFQSPPHFEFTPAMRKHALHCPELLRAPDVDPHLQRLNEGGVSRFGTILASDPLLREELHPIDKSQLDLANALRSIYVAGWNSNVREPSDVKFKFHHPQSCEYVVKSFFSRLYDRVRWGLERPSLAMDYYYTYKAKIHYLSTQFAPQPPRTPLWTRCANPNCECNLRAQGSPCDLCTERDRPDRRFN